ncbi:MAG TPA: DUF1080 domain-containing protein [Gemmata sp.]
MLRLLAAFVLLALAVPARADDTDKPKPNTLTPKEIADGWVLLFDGETTFGWKIDGAAEVKDGALILGKGKKTVLTPNTDFGKAIEVVLEWQGQGTILAGHTTLLFGPQLSTGQTWGTLRYVREANGDNSSKISGGDAATRTDVNDSPRLSATSLLIETNGKTPAVLRSIKLRPLGTKPLFSGKNLDGWKVNQADPKRTASKWEVTRDGALSVKNGPGDLVTEKEFDNFVLQFECKTNGKALNSGIFFRCIPGQYQNGYEAQIQNAFKDSDRTKPADFGTGAIYRRVPARKVVSNDSEWFTMTVVANGKHISTWVNGYQTVNWTDDRKENDNPRQGYRAAKGPLSIQGHDPTTDILFRNIRIASMP